MNEALKENKLVAVYKRLYVYQIGYTDLENFSSFVYNKYAYHYQKKYNWNPNSSIKTAMYATDKEQFKTGFYFGIKTINDEFIGTMKVSKRTTEKLSIEKDFDISIPYFIKNLDFPVHNIWHLGRLAVASELLRTQYTSVSSKDIIKNLLLHTLSYIAQNPFDIMFAESDVLIHKIFDELGLYMEIIGDKKEFLGSPTYPVMLTSKTIRKWLATQKEYLVK